MKKTDAIVTTIIFLGFLYVFAGLILFGPKRDYSDNERRYLAQMPELSSETVQDGTYMNDLETYLIDQFPARDTFVSINSMYQQTIGKRDIGGAYICRHGFYMTKLTEDEIDTQNFEANQESLKAFGQMLSEQGINYKVMLVPSASLELSDLLPYGASIYDQAKYLEAMKEALPESFIDLREVLADEEYYYKTDHHWTTPGAYEAYVTYAETADLTVERKRRYEEEIVSKDFRGTLYQKVLTGWSAKDTITAYKKAEELSIVADGNELSGIYKEDALLGTDQYSYFFGGNYGEMVISGGCEAGSDEAKRKLLVLKDSYANCFLPFLTSNYGEIYVLDLRYYNGLIKEYVLKNGIQDVLVLYGMDGFMEDYNVTKLSVGLNAEVDTAVIYQPKNHGEKYTARELVEQMLETVGKSETAKITSYGEALYIDNFTSLYGRELSRDEISDGGIGYANGNADEISVIYVYDESKISTMKYLMEERLERRVHEFEGYMPEELEKLENAKIVVSGNYVALIVDDESAELAKQFQELTKQ